MPSISLKSKMALGVSLLFVVFAAAISYFSIAHMEDKYRQSLADQQFALACAIANNIDDKLTMAQKALVSASLHMDPGNFADPARAQRFLDDRVTLHTLFDTTLFLLSRDGKIIAESPIIPGRRGTSLAYREYYRETMTTGKPVISSPFISSMPHHQPVVMLTAPVFDRRGKIAFVFCGGLRLMGANLLSEMRQIRIGKTGYIYLTTADRNMIMHPDRSRLMKSAAPPGVNKLFDRAVEGFDGSGETVNTQGIAMLASFKHLRTTNWILALNFPTDEAYAPMYRTRQYLLGGIVAGTLAMLAIAWLVMKRLTAPLETITRHVATLPGKSGSDKFITVATGDEIGTLAHAFNGMLVALDKQQKALQESERNFRALAETPSDGMLVISGDGAFAYANYRIAEITGYSIEELLQRGIRDLAHQDDYPRLKERFNRIIAWEEVPRQYETRMIRKDGSEVPVEVTSSLTIWEGESADLVVVRDITERRQMEKALRESYTLLQKTFASLNEAVFIVQTNTRIIEDCNITAEKMFGYTRDELIGACTSCLHVTAEMSCWFGSEMMRSYGEKGFFETIFQMKRKDGTAFASEHFVTPIHDDAGKIVSHVCVVRDISERKRTEDEISNLNRDLQRRATELAAANRDLEAFGYSLSHDLKSPLTGIYSAAQALAEVYTEHLDETGRYFIDGIRASCERMEEIINAVLLLSRISRSELQHDEIDLSACARGILLRLRMEEPCRTVTWTIAPEVKAVGDPRLVKSVLENLLGNAWKYTRKTPDAHIEIGTILHGGEEAYFVRDNGAGFSMVDADKLFKPFQRLHRDGEFEGTGIGLATVQRIIQRHGGRLWGVGTPGEGAAFYFTLPTNGK